MSSASSGAARRKVASPILAMLPRVSDGLAFLYIDIARVDQTETGVCAVVEPEDGYLQRTYLPTAALACVLLGPGTSITQRALSTLMRHGTTVIAVGSGGVLNDQSGPRPAPAFIEWLMGLEPGWVTDLAHGLTQNQMSTALGNGVLPLQAMLALTELEIQSRPT